MKRFLLPSILLCFAALAWPQTHTFPALDTNNTFTGSNTFTGATLGGGPFKPIYVDQQAGATADVKAAAACAVLPAFGGTLDFRGFGGSNQSVAALISCGSASQPVEFLFDPGTVYQPSTSSTNMFQFNSHNVFRDLFIDTSGQASYTGIPIQNSSSTSTQFAKLYNVRVKMASGSTSPCGQMTGTSASVWASQNKIYDFLCFAGTGGDGWKLTASGGGFVNDNEFYSLKTNGAKYSIEELVTDNTAGSSVSGNATFGLGHEASSLATSLAGVHMNTASSANAMFSNQNYGMKVFDLSAGNVSVIVDVGNICGTYFAGQLPAGSGGTGVTDNTTCFPKSEYHDFFDHTSSLGVTASTLKKGSGGGNYTNATTSYIVADSTNLCFTTTIPTGWKLSVSVSGAVGTATGAVADNVAITDNAACSTANAGILVETTSTTTAAGVLNPFSLSWVITGDGASHNVALQFKTSNGADAATLLNSSATLVPTMVFQLVPSN